MILEYLTEDIFYGTKIMESHLSINEKEYLYLTPNNIQDGKINKANSYFISKKVINKYYRRTINIIGYGDYVIVKKDNKFCIEKIEDFDLEIIPNNELIVLKTDLGLFHNAIIDQRNRRYFYKKLDSLSRKYNGNALLEQLKGVDFKIQGLIPSNEPEKFNKFQREPLDPSSINITDTKLPIQSIISRIRLNHINMFTGFQRGNLWKIKEQSRLIESIMIGFPIPSFYFDCSDKSNWLIIDGLQRLSTLQNFMIKEKIKDGDNEVKFELQNLEYLPEYNGKTFSELSTEMQLQIKDYNIRVLKIEAGTPQRVKYSLFERINTVGLALTSQEIRHALNQRNSKNMDRNPAEYLKELSDLKIFKEFWGRRHKNKMQDREAILRYIAFKIKHYRGYKPDMKDFLDDAMTEIYNVSEPFLNDIKIDFEKALSLVKFIWKDNFTNAFAYSRKFNSPLFEVICYYFSMLKENEITLIKRRKYKFIEKYSELIENNDYKTTISTDNQKTIAAVNYRFEKFEELLKEILKNDK